mgnify:CR=1 FL=1
MFITANLKFINYIKNSFLLFSKLNEKVLFYLRKSFLNLNNIEQDILKEQNELFKKNNLDRDKGLSRLNLIYENFPFAKKDMNSEHQTIFSSISISKSFKIKRVLEIGTYDGINSFILSKLFPHSQITTIDLKDTDQTFLDTYSRKDKLSDFVRNRNEIINKSKNIKYLQINSLELTFLSEKFDLIWIDGAHGYPIVNIDICNSLRLCNQNGLILCDDVFTNTLKNDSMYKSIATFETLQNYKQIDAIKFDLFYKRLSAKINIQPAYKKYVAFVKLSPKK